MNDFTRATRLSTYTTPYAEDKKTAYFLPPVEWTTAALTQLAPAPSVAAVTMGKGAKGTARPSLVRRWEASVAAGQDGTGCAMAARATEALETSVAITCRKLGASATANVAEPQ